MAQHFLLTAGARSMSPLAIARLSDDKAHTMLCELRWGSMENVVCPKCSKQHKAYYIATLAVLSECITVKCIRLTMCIWATMPTKLPTVKILAE